MILARYLSMFAVFVAVAGCGGGADKLNRQAATGTVTFKGQPLKYGALELVPADGQQTSGRAVVTDGKFDIPKAGGLSPGKYIWRLTSPDPPPNPNAPPADVPGEGPATKELIPVKYNSQSKEIIEVKAGDATPFTIVVVP